MMQLLRAWKESLAVFWPSNFKVLLLVTLKTIMQVIVPLCLIAAIMSVIMFFYMDVLGSYFVLILLPVLMIFEGMVLSLNSVPIISYVLSFHILNLKVLISNFVQIFLYVFLLSPSVMQKNIGYKGSYWKHLFYLICLYVPYEVIGLMVLYYGMFVASFFLEYAPNWLALSVALVFALLRIILNVIEALYILFFLDTHGTLRDILPVLGRALRMVVYLLPAFLIIYVGMDFIRDIIVYYVAQILVWTSLARFALVERFFVVFKMLISFVQLVFRLSLLSTLYTKQVHEHFNRYFPQEGV